MMNACGDYIKIRNIESPFTELFSLLMSNKNMPNELRTLEYRTNELEIMSQHADNAIGLMLQGLQDLGGLLGKASQGNQYVEELNNIGYFISAVSNLTEALNNLRSDAKFILEKKIR